MISPPPPSSREGGLRGKLLSNLIPDHPFHKALSLLVQHVVREQADVGGRARGLVDGGMLLSCAYNMNTTNPSCIPSCLSGAFFSRTGCK